MKIRMMQKKDREEVAKMMRVFYDSPAVLTKAPDEILYKDIDDCLSDLPFIEGFVIEMKQDLIGYAMAAKSYSTEFGGICIWIEDIYIKPECQGQGIGPKVFEFIEDRYKKEAVRIRLEAEEENIHAVSMYKKQGYQVLPYVQMTKENSQNVHGFTSKSVL